MKIVVSLFVASILGYTGLFAQTDELVFTRMTKENGLASSRVIRMLQDHQGFYWMSTFSGLQRFDGQRMVTFQHNPADSASLPDNSTGALMEDHQNRLWISSGGIPCIYEPLHRRFKKVPVDYKGKDIFNIQSFYQDSRGLIWMVAEGDDLFVLDTVKNIFRSCLFIWPKYSSPIIRINEDKKNKYYWLTTDKGIVVYDPVRKEYYYNGYNPAGLQCFNNPAFSLPGGIIYVDYNDIGWIQIWDPAKGYLHFRYDIKNNELIPLNLGSTHLWGYITDASGITWAYGNILGHYDQKTNTFIEVQPRRNSLYGIDFNEIFSAYMDNENNLWLATNLGLYTFNSQKQYFITYTSLWSDFLKQQVDGNINGFIETRDGHIIVLGWGGEGLYFYDTAFNRVPALYGFERSRIKNGDYVLTWCGLQDRMGTIWVGSQHGCIIQLDPSSKKFTILKPPAFEERTIRSITEDQNGNIWFGTQNNIIVKWTRSTNTFKQIVPLSREKYTLGWILRILRGNNNDLWAATVSGGMLHLDINADSVTEQFLPDKKNPASIGSPYVRDIIPLNADTLVLVTGQGLDLFTFRAKSFTHITTADGLPSESIFSIAKDNNNNFWFSTVDGISKIHLPDKLIHNYGPGDGITEQDFQLRSAARFSNNRIAFGNTRGFVTFRPDAVKETHVPADVLVTGFRIFNHSLSVDSMFQPGNKIRLGYSQNYITIQFASLNNILNSLPDYYYRLEGIDKDWVKAGSAQEANYTYLPEGDYTFKVRCVSQDGIKSKNVTSFRIHISPPFWKTWWFIALLLSIIAGISYYIYLLQMRRRNEREIIRNRIARDLHDDMGSTLSTINILSSMAKSKLNTDEVRTSEYINKIGDNSQRMMEAMDDIVWAIKPDNDSMQKIVARMREFSTSVLEAKDIDLEFHVDEHVNNVKLNMEQRRDFFLVFKEAVNNAAKYSKCKKAIIQVGARQKRLVLIVKDNGIGFDVMAADNGNGLGNMHKRADGLKGRLQVHSRPGEGTTVTLNIPVR